MATGSLAAEDAFDPRIRSRLPTPWESHRCWSPATTPPPPTTSRSRSASIEHLGLRPAFLLGHSHGGFVAQRYALEHSERLTGLILYERRP
ncbi:MAG: alpha/beta fold hydrolase [Haloechinothrix sp.]